jgi:3-hydroxy-9,10-secoandrosta-1,3,5(10)-triene-9,17-dione monooxygenase
MSEASVSTGNEIPSAGRYDDVVRHAHDLVPVLRGRIREADDLRRLPDATCDDIRRTGIARILQPARYGGLEAPLHSMVDILMPIGVGCGSTSWVLAQYIMHNYMIARWPERAQDDVWNDKPDALVSGILIPRIGKAKRVEGGISLTGRWPFVTGVPGADWCILSGMTEDPDGGEPSETYFLIPSDEVEILDTWNGIGLKGTGSHDVQVTDLVVPDHRTVTIEDFKGGNFAGRATNSGALYRPPVYMTFGILLTSSVIGMAQYMLDEYLAQTTKSVTIMSGRESGSYQAQQIKVAEASAALQAAEALLREDCRVITERCADPNYQPGDIERSNYRCNSTYAGQRAYDAAKILWDLAGARAAYVGNDIGRVFLDILVATRHVTQNFDANATDHGRARVGLPLANPSL